MYIHMYHTRKRNVYDCLREHKVRSVRIQALLTSKRNKKHETLLIRVLAPCTQYLECQNVFCIRQSYIERKALNELAVFDMLLFVFYFLVVGLFLSLVSSSFRYYHVL